MGTGSRTNSFAATCSARAFFLIASLLGLTWAFPGAGHAQPLNVAEVADGALPSILMRPIAPRRGYRLYRWSLPLARVELDLRRLPAGRGIRRALVRARAALVVNSGFFDGRGRTLGLSIANGRQITPYSSRLGGGVVTVRRGVAELHAASEFRTPVGTEFAVQAKPRLVVGSQAVRMWGPQLRADRTALCLRDSGRTLDVVVARSLHPVGHGGPTLRQLARNLAALGCESALNLDGGRSTAVAWRHLGRLRMLPPRDLIRQVIVVRPRPVISTSG